MAIVHSFEEWRAELQSNPPDLPIKILTDHKNLEYFMTNKLLTRRQARWMQFLSQFDFKIVYQTGKKNAKPDALTRRSEDLPDKEGDERNKVRATLIKPQQVLHLLADSPVREGQKTIPELFAEAYEADTLPNEILEKLRQGTRHSRHLTLSECEEQEGRLVYRNRLHVPDH